MNDISPQTHSFIAIKSINYVICRLQLRTLCTSFFYCILVFPMACSMPKPHAKATAYVDIPQATMPGLYVCKAMIGYNSCTLIEKAKYGGNKT